MVRRRRPAKIGRRVRAKALGDNRDLRYYVAQYDANIRVADEHIRQALDHARQLGLLDDALVVFTADHGESLGEHDYYFGHGRLPYNTSAHVPLVVVLYAGSNGGRGASRRRWSWWTSTRPCDPWWRATIEVAGLEGDSLVPLLGDAGARREAAAGLGYAFSQAGGGGRRAQYRSVQDGRWKLILRPARGGQRPRPERWELYRLDHDPMETENLLEGEAEEFRRLRHELETWMADLDGAAPRADEAGPQSEEALKALKALGYLD